MLKRNLEIWTQKISGNGDAHKLMVVVDYDNLQLPSGSHMEGIDKASQRV